MTSHILFNNCNFVKEVFYHIFSLNNLKVVDEEEVSESQVVSGLTNFPPELLTKILSYLSTYGYNFTIDPFGYTFAQKDRPFQSKKMLFCETL